MRDGSSLGFLGQGDEQNEASRSWGLVPKLRLGGRGVPETQVKKGGVPRALMSPGAWPELLPGPGTNTQLLTWPSGSQRTRCPKCSWHSAHPVQHDDGRLGPLPAANLAWEVHIPVILLLGTPSWLFILLSIPERYLCCLDWPPFSLPPCPPPPKRSTCQGSTCNSKGSTADVSGQLPHALFFFYPHPRVCFFKKYAY